MISVWPLSTPIPAPAACVHPHPCARQCRPQTPPTPIKKEAPGRPPWCPFGRRPKTSGTIYERIRGCQRNNSYVAENGRIASAMKRSEEHTSELQSQSNLVCRLLLEKKKRRLR